MIPAGLVLHGKITYCREAFVPAEVVAGLSDDEKAVFGEISSSSRYVSEDRILKKYGLRRDNSILPSLLKKKLIYANISSASGLEGKTRRTATLAEIEDAEHTYARLTPKQRAVIEALRDAGSATVSELCYFTGVTASVVLALENKGLLQLREEHVYSRPSVSYSEVGHAEEILLTEEQSRAFESLKTDFYAESASCSLLYGVTGSGKTKVYMRLIDEALLTDRGVILMVPEISLTPQTLALFYSRYGKKVAVFHSGLSAGERADEWKRVKRGEAQIAVGTRSAVFAPFADVGLIVIDEEQEHTYKSERSPRYDAIDVAKYICGRDNALLVLASATPSMVSFSKARAGRYKLLRLTKRYGTAVLPQVRVVDMSAQPAVGSLSEPLIGAIGDNLKNNKQTILLMNRRGYNTFVACQSCKTVVSCPSCSISLTYHRANNRLMCHYCGYSAPYTETCPHCGGSEVRYSGFGTQRVEDELHALFPEARVLRMDADTTMAKNAHEKKLKAFADGQYDILIGTQMVAKGLDFPNVTLTGVVSADMGVYKDDYRSGERAFDLLTQVIGRAGRRTQQGLAMIQTVSPDNEIIHMSAKQDYDSFYASEIENRRMMIYPPFCDICMVGFVSEQEIAARAGAQRFLADLKRRTAEAYSDQRLIVIGPNPSFIHKMGNKYRYRLIIKCKNSKRFRAMIRALMTEFMKNKLFKNVSIFAVINPESMF